MAQKRSAAASAAKDKKSGARPRARPGIQKRSQEEPGGAGRSQEEPGGARKSREEPGKARRSQEAVGALGPAPPSSPHLPIWDYLGLLVVIWDCLWPPGAIWVIWGHLGYLHYAGQSWTFLGLLPDFRGPYQRLRDLGLPWIIGGVIFATPVDIC